MPCVLEDEEEGDLHAHCKERGEGDAGIHAKVFADWVEEPDLGEFDSKVG